MKGCREEGLLRRTRAVPVRKLLKYSGADTAGTTSITSITGIASITSITGAIAA